MKLETPRKSEEERTERIKESVRARTGTGIRDLQVELRNGAVYLSGRTSSYYYKQLATHAAFDLLGTDVELSNDIEVD